MGRRFRVSPKPGKTLLWLWLKKDLLTMKGELGVDLAGGSMLNRRFFRTEKYISVDINQVKLNEGLQKHPDAEAVNSSIMDYLDNLKDEKPDVLVCVQTMGTNQFFDHDETYLTVEKMHEVLRSGGGMIFNVGSVGVDLNDIERRLNNLLKGKFKSVKSSFYGAFHSGGGQPRWDIENDGIVRRSNDTERPKSSRLRAMISLSVAYLMYMLPPLRTGFGLKKRKLYFCCKGKL